MNKKDLEKLGLTAEALEKAGLAEDVLDKIIIAHGKDIEGHKSKLAALEGEKDELGKQLASANEAIDGFKKLDPEGIKKAATDWETKAKAFEEQAKKAAADAETKVASLKFDHALDAALSEAKARNPKAVRALLKTEDLKLSEDGSVVGLKEQLEAIKGENDFLFSDADPQPKIVVGANNPTPNMTAFQAAAMKGAGFESKG